MLADGYKGKYLSFRRSDRTPFQCTFRGEAAADCGGPMRDLVSNVCEELMQNAVPILTPTQNNLAKIEPYTDCIRLNPALKDKFWLKRLVFFGYFLGWSLRTMGGLGLELPPCFWSRICGGPNYIYTLEDLKQMDKYRYDDLKRLIDFKENCVDDETFSLQYEGHMFDADFG